MKSYPLVRTPLLGRISMLAPVVVAVSLMWAAPVRADQAAASAALQAELQVYASQKVTPGTATPAAPSFVTAVPDDLTFAVYNVLSRGGGNFTPAEVVAVAIAADPVSGRTRADINTIVGRIVNAAIDGADVQTSPDDVTAIVNAVATSSNTRITYAGRAVAVGAALKASTGTGAALGSIIGTLSNQLTGTTDVRVQTFATAALRAVGASTAEVSDFVNAALNTTTSDSMVARNIAAGVVAQPAVAGQVIGGAAANLGSANIFGLLQATLADARLARAQAYAVGAALDSYDGDKSQFAVTLLDSRSSLTLKGNVVAGTVQSLVNPTDAEVNTLITNVINASGAKPTTAAAIVAFGAAAVAGTGEDAGLVTASLASRVPTDSRNLTALGASLVRSIATSSPANADLVVSALLTAGNTVFTTPAAQISFGATLVRNTPTNGIAAGAVAAGTFASLAVDQQTLSNLASVATATIAGAPRVAAGIAGALVNSVPAGSTSTDLARTVVSSAGFSVAYAPAVAAGIAAADSANAGAITAGVASSSSALAARAGIIAASVAAAVPVEAISDVAQSIGSLYGGTTAAGGRYPALSALGSLATSLAQAINTKATVLTTERVDELSELASTLSKVAVSKISDQTALTNSLIGIASGVIRALSPRLMQDGYTLAADKGYVSGNPNDALYQIAGAVAQAVNLADLDPAVITNLLKSGGALENALVRLVGAPFASRITGSFQLVRNTPQGQLAQSPTGNNKTVNGGTSVFENGSFVEDESPVAPL